MLKAGFLKCLPPCLLIVAAVATPSVAMLGDTVADRVFGQADFVHSGANNVTAGSMFHPISVAIDKSTAPNRIYVADLDNSRVLAWKDVTAFSNGSPADLVIGQPDFVSAACDNGATTASSMCAPQGVAVDPGGNLYVADTSNNRVLEYNAPFAGCGSFPCVVGSANMVFGQGGTFTSGTCNKGGLNANSLCSPEAVALDAVGNLYVADTTNSRVLEYDAPLTTDTTADRVFGQSDSFTTGSCNNHGTSAKSLCEPSGVLVDAAGNLYVADLNSRVLEYNTPLTTDTTADRVFGQSGDFTSNTCNLGGTSASSLCDPDQMALDAGGNLYVADVNNNRVLEYNTPLSTDTVADVVFGEPDFVSTDCNNGGLSASSLCNPAGVGVDAGGNLYVGDLDNNRVLKYTTPLSTDTIADQVLGQPDFSHDGVNLIDARGLFGPTAVAIDTSTSPNRLYVADADNYRVLGYKDVTAYLNGRPADLVIGQPDFSSGVSAPGDCVASASRLCSPEGVAVDPSGNLYVADTSNNRVLEYNAPFAGCASFPCVVGPANMVFGQGGSFNSNAFDSCNTGSVDADTLCFPQGVAADANGNLYIADTGDERVLEYNTPTSTDTTADVVFGQGGDFTSNNCNDTSADSLCAPTGVATDAVGNLYIADIGNNRVLEYNTTLTTDTTADFVFGQGGDFTSDSFNSCNTGAITAGSLCLPQSVAVDINGNLYVADLGNNRALEYITPLTTDLTADVVFGQLGSFLSDTEDNGGVTAESLSSPSSVAIDAVGNLYVADTDNNRVLEYDMAPFPTPTATPTATAKPTSTATATQTSTSTATATPTATATTTATATQTATATSTATATVTSTATATATPTATATASATATGTATSTPTATPTCTAPISADQCRSGGWQQFTCQTFVNQGQCISSLKR